MRFYKYSSILLLGLAIKFWFFQPYIVVSDSMANTLNKGDYIIMNTWEKSLFRNHKTLQKNDIFAFFQLDYIVFGLILVLNFMRKNIFISMAMVLRFDLL